MEFTLSDTRFFAALRMTRSEGFRVRMTGGEGLRMTQSEGLAMTERRVSASNDDCVFTQDSSEPICLNIFATEIKPPLSITV